MNRGPNNCCYLCGSTQVMATRRQRAIRFKEKIFKFNKCKVCKSYSLFPRLSFFEITALYSMDYATTDSITYQDANSDYLSKFQELDKFLKADKNSSRIKYLDFGCGFNPVSLRIAESLGLKFQGVEFSQDVVENANIIFPESVISVEEFKKESTQFDYIFLGDVIEHFSDPISELREIYSRVSDQGLLLAQGPLQGASTLSHLFVQANSFTFRKRESNFPPYHVSLATKRGMKNLLRESNFEIIFMKISEPLWPAPSANSILASPTLRGVAVYFAKFIDRCLASLVPNYGSHYFLVARKMKESSKIRKF